MAGSERERGARGASPGRSEAGKAKMIVLAVAAGVTLLILAGTILMDVSSPLPTAETGLGPTPRIEQPTRRDSQKNLREPEPLPDGVLSG